jgi:hypothetical protein
MAKADFITEGVVKTRGSIYAACHSHYDFDDVAYKNLSFKQLVLDKWS